LLKEVYTGVNFLFAFHICGTKNQINMKQKFLLSFVLSCMFIVSTRAQISKGATWLGGQLGYSQSSDKSGSITNNKQTGFTISPAVGTAVKDNLIVGIAANYLHYKIKSDQGSSRKDDTYGGGLFIRKYIPVVSRLYIFGDARAYFNRVKSEDISGGGYSTKIKGVDVGIAVTPGVSYAVTKSIQIETGLNSLFNTRYSTRKQNQGFTENKNKTFTTGLFLDNTSQVFIGFRFLINKKA
jgi:opacity protein-like surface antigen